jgi:shikimate kinase
LRKLRTHGGIILGIFFGMNDIGKSTIVAATAKKLKLAVKS